MSDSVRAVGSLSPLEAYDHVMRFARARGEDALLLALHAAVPQVLRPELLHLLRLNFVTGSLDAAAIEADVLFASFCEELGNGYYRFDAGARHHLLRHLDPAYEEHAFARSRQVASFLLSYLDRQSRDVEASSDPVYTAFLEVERWVALAFLDADTAAIQLAEAVRQASDPGNIAARLRIGGLTAALSAPLAHHPTLLAYAAGIEMLEKGFHADARRLLEPLGELEVGGVRLPSPRQILKTLAGRQKKAKTVKIDQAIAQTKSSPSTGREFFFCCADGDDLASQQQFFREVSQAVRRRMGHAREVGFLSPEQNLTHDWSPEAVEALRAAKVLVAMLSPAFLRSERCAKELGLFELRSSRIDVSHRGRSSVIPIAWAPIANSGIPDRLEALLHKTVAGQNALRDTRGAARLQQTRGAQDEYRQAVERLAVAIVDATNQDPLPPLREVPSFASAPAFWEVDDPPARRKSERAGVYVSHSPADRKWAAQLRKYGANAPIEFWDDTAIGPGEAWSEQIAEAIGRARVAVVLVSADKLASEYFLDNELPLLEDAAARGSLVLTWICIRACLWDRTSLGRFRAAHDPSTPLASLRPAARDRTFTEIIQRISEMVRRADKIGEQSTGARTQSDRPHARQIYISYRRGDSPDHAARLHDSLSGKLTGYQLWMAMGIRVDGDVDDRIVAGVRPAAAVVVVIGPEWLTARDETSGKRRLDDPKDSVRIEIASALELGIRVLPVLVGGAQMPAAQSLPSPLVGLASRMAMSLRDEAWDADVADLVGVLVRVAGEPTPHDSAAAARRPRVFMSGTIADLAEFRDAVIETLRRLDYEVAAPEFASATEQSSRVDEIGRSDVLVLIVGWRYGAIPSFADGSNAEELSVTELEYRAARDLGKPVFAFLASEEVYLESRSVTDMPDERVRRFREVLSRDINPRMFRNTRELTSQVIASVESWRRGERQPQQTPASGHVLLFVGHTIDQPLRGTPRFPVEMETIARGAIEHAVIEESQKHGGILCGIASGSHGGDILFLEVCSALNIATRIYLPVSERQEFRSTFVDPAWGMRFDRVAQQSVVHLAPENSSNRADWRVNGETMVRDAAKLGTGGVTLIALWDGISTSWGGPSDVLSMAQQEGFATRILKTRELFRLDTSPE